MSSLHELATDILNKAKSDKSPQSKIFSLEQVKEIIFHRDKSLLTSFVPEMLNLMVEKSTPLRKFLIKLAGDSVRREDYLIPAVISLFSYLVNDAQEPVLKALLIEISSLYDRIVSSLSLLQSKAISMYSHSPKGPDGKDLWMQLKYVINILLEKIPLKSSDSIKLECIRLTESVTLFGIAAPIPKEYIIERIEKQNSILSRKRKYQLHNVTEIPLHHPHIDRNIVEAEADTLLSKLALWARRGGPQENPFSPELLLQLGKSLGRIACLRPSSRKNNLLALSFLLDRNPFSAQDNIDAMISHSNSLSNIAAEVLDIMASENTSSSTTTSKTAATPSNDYDTSTVKLRESLRQLNTKIESYMNLKRQAVVAANDNNNKQSGTDSKKLNLVRKRSDILDKGEGDDNHSEDEEGDECEKGETEEGGRQVKRFKREDVVTALALAQENCSSSQQSKGSDHQVTGNATLTTITELPSDLPSFPDALSSNVRLAVAEEVAVSAVSAGGTLAAAASAGSSVSHFVIRPMPPSDDMLLANMALDGLKRMLIRLGDTMRGKHGVGTNIQRLQLLQLCVRLTLSLSLAELDSGRPPVRVPVLRARATSGLSKHALANASPLCVDDIPTFVHLPRPLWLCCCYALGAKDSGGEAIRVRGTPSTAIDELLLFALLDEIFFRSLASASALASLITQSVPGDAVTSRGFTDHDVAGPFLYDNLFLALFSRMIQRKELREVAKKFLKGYLPRIPPLCLALCQLVMESGTLPSGSSGSGGGGGGSGEKDKGTRILAMTLIGQVVASPYQAHATAAMEGVAGDGEGGTVLQLRESSKTSLLLLLMAAVSEDFGLRSKAVTLLVEEIVSVDDEVLNNVCEFVVQSAASLFDNTLLLSLLPECQDRTRSSAPVATEEVEGGAMEEDRITTTAVEEESSHDKIDEDEEDRIYSLSHAANKIKRGLSSFSRYSCPYTTSSSIDSPSPLTSSEVVEVEAIIRRQLHLMSKLCIRSPHLLTPLLDVFAAASRASDLILSKLHLPPPSEISAAAPDAPLVREPARVYYYQVVARVVQDELLKTLLPALARQYSAADLFGSMCRADPVARPIVVLGLDVLLPDHQLPPDPVLITRVKLYIGQIKEATTAGSAASEATILEVETRLLSILIGGLSTTEVLGLLPNMISLCCNGVKENTDFLRKSFSRVVQARPPPLSQSQLLVALHRLDHAKQNVQPKGIVDAIGLCLTNRTEFSSTNIREALTELTDDVSLSLFLMRTVILSAQAYSELRKFGLAEVVPKLIRLRTWEKAPRVWDGVVMFVKSYGGHRDAEMTLRALLELPGPQLRALIKIATTVKDPLSKVWRAMSVEEKSQLVSPSSATGATTNETQEADEDIEKNKILKELLSSS